MCMCMCVCVLSSSISGVFVKLLSMLEEVVVDV